MNIVIPMGGLGDRFRREGYRFPKPLVNICGRPMLFWLLDNLDLQPGDTIWLAMVENLNIDFQFVDRIHTEYSKVEVRTVTLNFQTRGASETLYCILGEMDEEYLKRKTISLDCDSWYWDNILQKFRDLPPGQHATFTFEDTGNKPIFSYVACDPQTRKVSAIREKQYIDETRHANTGAYAFATGAELKKYCAILLDGAVGAAGEYYTSSVIARMLQDGGHFVAINVEKWECTGTPKQLQDFLTKLERGDVPVKRLLRFVFDLDNTLVSHPKVRGDYSTCTPLWKNIKIVRRLKAMGHYIIIQTARRMKTHKGNAGAVVSDIGEVTFKNLRDFEIPFDEIFFGKPWGHVYVDDASVNAFVDTEKEIGCTPSSHTNPDIEAMLKSEKASIPAPRPSVIVESVRGGNELKKSSRDPALRAEARFYQALSPEARDLFPRFIAAESLGDIHSITLERIPGISFMHLAANRCLTEGRLLKFLSSLYALHNAPSAPTEGGGILRMFSFSSMTAPSESSEPPYVTPNAIGTLYDKYGATYDCCWETT